MTGAGANDTSAAHVEMFVAVHLDHPKRKAILVSDDDDADHARWILRAPIRSFHLNGKTTRGTDRSGHAATFTVGHLVIPEWLAKREGLI